MPTAELVFRVGVAVFVILAPTAMFLGFWRLLMRMRNGELVERVMSDDRVAEEWSGGDFAQPAVVQLLGSTGASSATCPHCGTTNSDGAGVCAGCLRRL